MKERKYKAFISYSHRDEKFATWLHKKLETYKIPKELQEDYSHTLPNKLFPLFRDRAELSTSPTLGEEILKALTNSEYLIVICSTYSAKSKYVNQEIIDFKRIHGEGKVHAIIIDGEPHAKESDKFSDDLECFPEALKYKVIDGKLTNKPIEPIAGDFRKGKDGKEEGKLKLIAGLLRVDFDDLNRREERRKRRNRWIWGVIASILFVMMLGLTIFSLYQKDRAEQSEIKIKNELYINSMQKGILYRDFLNKPIKAKHIFARTIRNSPDKEKENSAKIAYNALNKDSKFINIAKHSSAIVKAIFSNDGKKILSWDKNGTVMLWNEHSQHSRIIMKHENEVYEANFSNDGKKVLIKSNGIVKFWSEKTNEVSVLVNSKNRWSSDASYGALFTKDGENILFWGDKKVSLWDIDTKKINSIKFKNDLVKVSFNKDEKEILLVCSNSISIWHRDTNKIEKIVKTTNKYRIENAFYSNSERYILYFIGTSVYIWDKKIEKSKKIITHKYVISGALFDKNDTEVISWSYYNRDKTIRVWDEINGERIITKYKGFNNYASNVKLSESGRFFVSYDNIRIFLWDSKNTIFRSTIDGKVNLFNKKFYEISLFHNYNLVSFDDTEENIFYKDDSSIYLWDITQNTQTKLINNVNGYAINKSRTRILAWDDFGNLILWNKLLEKSRTIIKHDSKVKGAIFSSDNKKILSWDENGNIKLLINVNNQNEKLYKVYKQYAREASLLTGIQSSKDGKELLIWSDDKGVKILDIKNNSIKLIIPYKKFIIESNHKISVSYATFNKNEDEVISSGLDGKIKLWKRESDQIETIMEFNSKLFKNNEKENKYVFIEKILYSNDEKLVVAWLKKDNYKIKLWNRDTRKSRNIVSCSDEGICEVKFNHKGNQLLVLCRDGKLKLWDKSTNKVNIITDNKAFFNSAEFTKDDKNILIWGVIEKSKYKNTIRIWNKKNHKIRTILKYKNIDMSAGFLFNKNSDELLIWGVDNSVKLWNKTTNIVRTIIRFNKNYSSSKAIYSQNEDRIFGLDNDTIKIWNRETNKITDTIHYDNINSFTINKTSNKILSWDLSEIRIYDMDIKKDILKMKDILIDKVEFSNDEKQLIITTKLGLIKKYNLYKNIKLNKKNYILDAEVQTGTYLTPLGVVKTLSYKEWLEKKRQYKQLLEELK